MCSPSANYATVAPAAPASRVQTTALAIREACLEAGATISVPTQAIYCLDVDISKTQRCIRENTLDL